MLLSLSIRDFVLIEKLDLTFTHDPQLAAASVRLHGRIFQILRAFRPGFRVEHASGFWPHIAADFEKLVYGVCVR